MDKHNIDIAAISETRFPGSGKLSEKEYTFFWSGLPETETRHAGVGFAIRNSIVRELVEIPIGVNERLMTLRISLTKDKYVTLISAYAPTLTNPDEVKDRFYEDLRHILLQVPPQDSILLLGDFNARVGNDCKIWPKVIGKHLLGSSNSNGLLLLSLCTEFELTITNSTFQLPDGQKGTWCHPRSKHWHTIDFVITRQCDLKQVRVTRAHRGTECWSDHRLVKSKINISLQRKPRRTKSDKRKKINVESLNNYDSQLKFAENLKGPLEKCVMSDDIENSWKMFKETLYETSSQLLGFTKRKNQDWFNENDKLTSSLIETMHKSHKDYMCNKNSKRLKSKYLSTKQQAQKRLRLLKDTWWKTKAEELQTAADTNNTKEFYLGLKAIYGPKINAISPLLSADGKDLLFDEDKILQRWKEHFSEVLNRESSADPATINAIKQQKFIPELDCPPSISETSDAIKKLCRGKKPGKDEIPPEVYKAGGTHLVKKLTELLKKIWEKGEVPQDFKDASIASLFKKGQRSLCDNYRGISLLSVAGKILARVILTRLNHHLVDQIYSESQCGFRKGRGTTDMIFCLRQLQEKAREHKTPLFMAFIDLTKAFDTVPRSALWIVLEKLGVPHKMRSIIISFHDGMLAEVIHNGKVSDAFEVNNGTKQGCVLAPILFALYFAVMLQNALHGNNFGVPITFRTTGGLFNIRRFTAKTKLSLETICDLLFADDCALVAHSMNELQTAIDSFSRACKLFGLTISTKKTEIIHQRPANSTDQTPCVIKVDNVPLKINEKFCYLGSTVNEKASLDDELKLRISKASSAFGKLQDRLWNSHDVRLSTKIQVYKAAVIPTLLYSSETWTPYRKHINMLNAFHMRKLRAICNITWEDKITNHEVLSKCQITGIEAFMMRSQLRWTGHVVRMDNTRLPKALLYGQIASVARPPGRPLLRFKDKLKANINSLKIKEKDWESTALDRPKWRATCHSAIANFENNRLEKMVKDRNNRKHPEQSSVGTSFVCSTCERRCKSKAGLAAHQRSHTTAEGTTDDQSRTCQICSKVCKNNTGLKIHMRVHNR